MSELAQLQRSLTAHLRDPQHVPVPAGMNPRRVGVYRDLVFGNVSSLLADFFPVLRSILDDARWDAMVRGFFVTHMADTPCFPQIAGEFTRYLMQRQVAADEPGFLPELAHYEWVELDLFISEHELPQQAVAAEEVGSVPLLLSPLARPLSYRYPVHRISPDFQPQAADGQPACLLVFRGADEAVHFFEIQPLAWQLLHGIETAPGLIAEDWLVSSGSQAGLEGGELARFVGHGLALLRQFAEQRLFDRATVDEPVLSRKGGVGC